MTKTSKGKYRAARAAEKLFSWTNLVDAKIVKIQTLTFSIGWTRVWIDFIIWPSIDHNTIWPVVGADLFLLQYSANQTQNKSVNCLHFLEQERTRLLLLFIAKQWRPRLIEPSCWYKFDISHANHCILWRLHKENIKCAKNLFLMESLWK